MRKADVIKHFKTQTAAAAALDVSVSAISQWDEVVPVESAKALELLTHSSLKVDWSLYPATKRALRELRSASNS